VGGKIGTVVKRYIVLLCGVFCCVAGLRAQFDPQIGQYMHMQSTYNPAAVGESDLMRVYGAHRMQFTGIMDAPMTTYFSFSSPFVVGKTQHAAGVRFMNDRFGLFSNQSLHAGYAYRLKLGKGYLSVGADLGFINLSFAVDSVNLKDVADLVQDHAYHNATDNAIPESSGQNGVSGMGFDLGLGVYYATSTWWAGVSYGHVTQPTLQWSERTEVHVRGTFYAAGGYNWRLRDKRWLLMPSAMVQTDFAGWDVNLTMMAQVNDRYRFGLGYRIAGSVNILLGMDIIDGLQVGYTYELPANGLIRESYGSHELYLAYGFNILKPKRTNRYKSVRYL
jgi:type IX secretion system PorP/SprF family membrane protein